MAAMLNNQPMGFYSTAVLIKDAQRHGLKVLPIDVTRSQWLCTVENRCMRLGLLYVRGLRQEAGEALVHERERVAFSSVDDLARRVPELRKDELRMLAEVGALQGLAAHRRDALWHAECAARPPGEMFEPLRDVEDTSPLKRMTIPERLLADYRGTGLTLGKHPLAYRRAELTELGVSRAADLEHFPDGCWVRVAGGVIVRQRPGTAKGFMFLSMEDESGVSNIIVTPKIFDANRAALTSESFLLIEGALQNVDNTVAVRARRIRPLSEASQLPAAKPKSFR
jgi:error-prone DNA polymerase